jgi:hypothetical protein
MSEMQMGDRVVTEVQAAEILGRAVQTLRNDRHLRQGPAYIKLGRSVRYKVSDLLKYLESHRIDPEAIS